MAQTPPPGDDAATPPAVSNPDPPLPTGWFRFYFANDRWEWSPETAQIHGYASDSVMSPSTELVMSHKHPDDYAGMAAHLDHVRRTHEALSTRHRIIDANGATRDVVVVGQQMSDGSGEVIGTHGFYVDVTHDHEVLEVSSQPPDDLLRDALAVVVKNRSTIEQAKGMLMLVYSIDADKAFDLLRWRSQEANVKLRLFAEQLVEELLALTADGHLPTRQLFDHVLLTAHQRVVDKAGDG